MGGGVGERVAMDLEAAHELAHNYRVALDNLPSERTPTAADWSRLAAGWRSRLDDRIADLVSLRDQLDSCIGCGCLSLDSCGIYNTEDRARLLGTGPRYLLGDTAADASAALAAEAAEIAEVAQAE